MIHERVNGRFLALFWVLFGIIGMPSYSAWAKGYTSRVVFPRDHSSKSTRRKIASGEPMFKYISYSEKDGQDLGKRVEFVTRKRWRKFSEGGRLDYLFKFFYANTREISNRKL